MSLQARISALLAPLEPLALDIIDESEQHRGHGGWREGGETHVRLIIRSVRFDGLSRVDRHRLVNTLMGPEFDRGLHALAIIARDSHDR
jgi:BolA protein